MNNSSLDILSSSPVDHVDVSDHSSKETLKVVNGNADNDSTDNEGVGGSEWNWEEEEKESELNVEEEIQSMEIIEEKVQITLKPIVMSSRPKIDDNINDLDIKNKKLTKLEEQAEDFFSDFDMTPTFQPTLIATENKSVDNAINRLQMSMIANDNQQEVDDGWGDDDDSNWNNDDDL